MTRSYKLIFLNDVIPGMVLSDDLIDRHGQILLPRGTILTDKLLGSLRRAEMEMVPVVWDDDLDNDQAAKRALKQERLNILFRKHSYDNAEENANDILLQYLKHFRDGGKA